jgi:hypothetical protein
MTKDSKGELKKLGPIDMDAVNAEMDRLEREFNAGIPNARLHADIDRAGKEYWDYWESPEVVAWREKQGQGNPKVVAHNPIRVLHEVREEFQLWRARRVIQASIAQKALDAYLAHQPPCRACADRHEPHYQDYSTDTSEHVPIDESARGRVIPLKLTLEEVGEVYLAANEDPYLRQWDLRSKLLGSLKASRERLHRKVIAPLGGAARSSRNAVRDEELYARYRRDLNERAAKGRSFTAQQAGRMYSLQKIYKLAPKTISEIIRKKLKDADSA